MRDSDLPTFLQAIDFAQNGTPLLGTNSKKKPRNPSRLRGFFFSITIPSPFDAATRGARPRAWRIAAMPFVFS
jgi:hypothetical protein